MKATTIHQLLFLLLSLAGLSMVYFISLVICLPVIGTIIAVLAVLAGLFKVYRAIQPTPKNEASIPYLLITLLVTGMVKAGTVIVTVAEKYGGWDAWALWNYHARCMALPESWKTFFLPTVNEHSDYPLFLPSLNGFWMRVTGGQYFVYIPLITSIFISLSVIVLLTIRLAQKSITVATAGLYLLVTDKFFFEFGTAQYADTALGLFFLASIVAMELSATKKQYVMVTTALVASCCWIKNEGVILAGVFMLFNWRQLLTKSHVKYCIVGAIFPFLVWLTFKIGYATTNDLVKKMDHSTLLQVFDISRYQLINKYFKQILTEKFNYLHYLFYTSIAAYAISFRVPHHNWVMCIACLTTYLGIYVFTTQDLEWHLQTSLDRLMHQLMPAFLYLSLTTIAHLKWIEQIEQKFPKWVNGGG